MRTTEVQRPRHVGSTAQMTSVRAGRGSTGTGGSPRPAIPPVGREVNDRADVGGASQDVWDALTRARAEYAPMVLASAEEAVVRFYRPLAQTLARAASPRWLERVKAEQAASVALARAVVSWQEGAREGFDAFARAAIDSQLRLLAAAQGQTLPDLSQEGGQPANGAQPSPDKPSPEPIPRQAMRSESVTDGR